MDSTSAAADAPTRALAARIGNTQFETIPSEALTVAKQAVLGVTTAGIESFTDAIDAEPALVALLRRLHEHNDLGPLWALRSSEQS